MENTEAVLGPWSDHLVAVAPVTSTMKSTRRRVHGSPEVGGHPRHPRQLSKAPAKAGGHSQQDTESKHEAAVHAAQGLAAPASSSAGLETRTDNLLLHRAMFARVTGVTAFGDLAATAREAHFTPSPSHGPHPLIPRTCWARSQGAVVAEKERTVVQEVGAESPEDDIDYCSKQFKWEECWDDVRQMQYFNFQGHDLSLWEVSNFLLR